MIFDTHAHYDDEAFDDDREALLGSLASQGIQAVTNVAASLKSCETTLALTEQYPFIYGAIGVHPSETAELDACGMDRMKAWCASEKIRAVGEIGLDYHWMTAPKDVQEKVFRRQIQLSKDLGLPFVVHTRDALEDTYAIIKSEGVGPRGGIMHSFSGSLEEAKRFMDLGMMISFSGVVTFKKATDVQEAATGLPLGKILVETDAPYLAPVPKRGRENKTAYTRYVVDFIAELRGLTTEEVAQATYDNARKVFGLD